MKITAFNPHICTSNAQSVTELFEALGFEHAHKKTNISDDDITIFTMKHPDGFSVDVAQADQLPQDVTAIRMNVRNFDEAYEFLTARGFKNAPGVEVSETDSSKQILLVSPSGFAIGLVEHIRK